MTGKISKTKKTNKTRRKDLKPNRANYICGVRDHFDPFDGTLSSYKLLSAFCVGIISPARHPAAFSFAHFEN